MSRGPMEGCDMNNGLCNDVDYSYSGPLLPVSLALPSLIINQAHTDDLPPGLLSGDLPSSGIWRQDSTWNPSFGGTVVSSDCSC